MDDMLSSLKKVYCPPIDSALFFAILSDYELSEEASINEVRLTLDALKASAEAEESTAFDPSGSNNIQRRNSRDGSVDRAQSWNGDMSSRTEDTGPRTPSYSKHSWGIDDTHVHYADGDGVRQHDTELEGLPIPDKKILLAEMFPGLRPFDIMHTLKKCQNNFARTVEELLNQVFLLEEPTSDGEPYSIPRGIEAFMSPASHQLGKSRYRRRKKTTQAQRASSTPPPLSEKSTNSSNLSKWDQVQADVDYLTQRTYIPAKTIASTYHKHNASLHATILTLCASSTTNPYVDCEDPIIEAHAIDLMPSFPALSPAQLKALVHLTHPSTTSAYDLAKILATSSHPSSELGSIVPHYTRPTLSDADSTPTPAKHPPAPYLRDPTTASLLASRAFAQASASHRASKSNPLLSGASAYYSSLGHSLAAASASASSSAADALVASQSTGTQLDLHGLNVKDALRIARQKVEGWWEGGAAEWAREGKVQGSGGYRVVVGVGRHSEGGKGRLGPAVGGMLMREGWRVEVGEGVLVVRGRARQ